jgi:hypothetical protein
MREHRANPSLLIATAWRFHRVARAERLRTRLRMAFRESP